MTVSGSLPKTLASSQIEIGKTQGKHVCLIDNHGIKWDCQPTFLSVSVWTTICDTIKGNESLVENFNSYFLAPLSHNFIMLHSDPNPITIGYLVTELRRICQC